MDKNNDEAPVNQGENVNVVVDNPDIAAIPNDELFVTITGRSPTTPGWIRSSSSSRASWWPSPTNLPTTSSSRERNFPEGKEDLAVAAKAGGSPCR